ncbi:MAG TPA: hybrid sensor histidine kinase/response regulator [Thiotrichaceae bacterium]|nr:hybrid sensor histidine kinase/response regulator [Thiotrichaceae bacterium]
MDTLLVIDDQPDNIKLLLKLLSDSGFKVLVASDGQDGIETAEFTLPDLILLDVIMPEMDGFEACHALKTNEKTKNIPIIFMTARTDTVDKIKGFELGAADYIIKPFQHEEVLARVNTHLKLHKMHLRLVEQKQQLSLQKQQLVQQNEQLQAEINNRQQTEISLQVERDALAERTAELTQANAKLAHAAQLKDQFLANMSHELRTPLTAILGISEAFQDQFYGPINDKQQKFIRTLEKSARHLLALINDILDLSKIEAEKFTLSIGTVSVNTVCQASLAMIKEAANKKRLRISTTFDYAVDTIQADERRLTQIIVNLLSNAVKFTPEAGSIQLVSNSDIEQSMISFSVQDTGIGITENDLKRLFQPFVQLEGSFKRTQQGTGLGLYLVYRLTEMHGGSVSVESQVNQGSRFTVRLPWQQTKADNLFVAETEPQKIAPKIKSRRVENRHSSAVILLADDQKTISDILFESLTTLGYQVLVAQDGVEAVEQCKAKLPNLILMDIQMPVMNGLDAIQEIRADTNTAQIPIIALTALAMPGDKARCLSAGANDYLSKPVSVKKLVTIIEALL